MTDIYDFVINNYRELLWTIGSIVGTIGGLYALRKIFTKKPSFEIDNFELKIDKRGESRFAGILDEREWLIISFELWNGNMVEKTLDY